MANTEGPDMFVSITLTVALKDAAEWTTTFGIAGRAAIRQDVKDYVVNGVQGMGVFGNGEVEADITLVR